MNDDNQTVTEGKLSGRNPSPRGEECLICGAPAVDRRACEICRLWLVELEDRGGELGGVAYLERALRRVRRFVIVPEVGR